MVTLSVRLPGRRTDGVAYVALCLVPGAALLLQGAQAQSKRANAAGPVRLAFRARHLFVDAGWSSLRHVD